MSTHPVPGEQPHPACAKSPAAHGPHKIDCGAFGVVTCDGWEWPVEVQPASEYLPKLPPAPPPSAGIPDREPYLLTRRDRIRIEALKLAQASGHMDDLTLAGIFEDWITRER